jgi:large subunit ribosomal protein L3
MTAMADTEKTATPDTEQTATQDADEAAADSAKGPMPVLIGKKVGMTQVFEPDGRVVPVTVVHAEPNQVVRTRTLETDGYAAIQVGTEERKPKHTNRPLAGYFKAQGIEPRRILREARVADSSSYKVGDQITVENFAPGCLVDVMGTTKGKGFQGVMKRHNFTGGHDSHGSKTGRLPGSTGMSADTSEVYKGRKLPGRMGGGRLTVRNLKVVGVDPEANLIWIMGALPGAARGMVMLRPASSPRRRPRRRERSRRSSRRQRESG